MSIIGKSPAAPTKVAETVSLDKTGYMSVAADHNDLRLMSIQAYLDGMPWQVDAYYSQYLGKDNQIRELDTSLSPAHQQYEKIRHAELRVQSSNQSSFNSEDKTLETTGSAILLHIVPNEFDYFVAGAGFRRKGLYRVKTVERRSVDDRSVYLINYELDSYVTGAHAKLESLEVKVIRDLTYSRERLIEGMSPVIKTKDFENLAEIHQRLDEISGLYLQDHFDQGCSLLVVPGQGKVVYDHRLSTFVQETTGLGVDDSYLRVKTVSFDNERFMNMENFWSVLRDRLHGRLKYITRESVLVPKGSFWRNSWLRGPVFWPVDFYVYPKMGDVGFDDRNHLPRHGTDTIRPSRGFGILEPGTPVPPAPPVLDGCGCPVEPDPPGYLDDWNRFEIDGDIVPLIKPVNTDGTYVLSKDFYDDTENLCVLEILTRDYMQRKSLNLTQIKALVDTYYQWPLLERYYYTPILLLLMKDSLRVFYV